MKVKIFTEGTLNIMYIKDINYHLSINMVNPVIRSLDLSESIVKEFDINEEKLQNILQITSLKKADTVNKLLESRKVNKEIYKRNGRYSELAVALHPSRKCNYGCKYCFKDEEYLTKNELNIETAMKAIDYFVDVVGRGFSRITLDLSGSGEPLLRFNFIKQIIEYCEKKQDACGKNIIIMMSTNGSLITDEIAEYFKHKSNILVGISLDGGQEQNDYNRVYYSDRGTYKDTIRGIKKLENVNIGVSAVITEYNQDVYKIYDEYKKHKNIGSFSLRFPRRFTEELHSIKNINIPFLISSYKKILLELIDELNEGNTDNIFKFINGSDLLGEYIKKAINKGMLFISRCDAGIARFSVDQGNNIYACSVLTGNDKYLSGNISNGISKESVQKFLEHTSNSLESCSACWAQNFCSGECMASLEFISESNNIVDDKFCSIKKEMIKLAIWFINYLEEFNPKSLSELRRIYMKTYSYPRSNSAIWVIKKLTDHNALPFSYQEVSNKLVTSDSFTEPNHLLEYLNNDFKCEKLYSIVNLELVTKLDTPSIFYCNKGKQIINEYGLIYSIDNEYLTVEFIDSGVQRISKEVFIKKVSDYIFI